MPKKKGDVQRRAMAGTARGRIWTSVRILRRVTVPDLARTSGAGVDNIHRYLLSLARHAIIREEPGFVTGRRSGGKVWRLVRDTGPTHPVFCEVCGKNLKYACRLEKGEMGEMGDSPRVRGQSPISEPHTTGGSQ